MNGGVPKAPGVYAWWIVPGGLPGVPSHRHPLDEVGLDLLYVGIAPESETSKENLRRRVVGKHLRGNTGGSTFRYSLAALLTERENFGPVCKGKKFLLLRPENDRLSAWQADNLSVTWCERPEPWSIEDEVIATMQPPLNLAQNRGHPFHATMSLARERFRERARTNSNLRR
jgi:hypothetical protein